MNQEFTIPIGCDLFVSKETREKFMDAFVKAFEKRLPKKVCEFGGIPVYSDSYMPNDMGILIGPDPDVPGARKIVKILKFSA